MIDDHRGSPPLRLRALAGIVDDERVDVRQRAERDLRKAVGRERQRLARQPFQIAVLAHVDDRVRAEFPAQPAIEREIAVRRRQVRVVVAGARVDVVAARRLDPDHDVAERQHRERECAVHHMGIRVGSPQRSITFFCDTAESWRKNVRYSATGSVARTIAGFARESSLVTPSSSISTRACPFSGSPSIR